MKLCCLIVLITLCFCQEITAKEIAQLKAELTTEQRELAVETLRTVLRDQTKWVKVHSAEFLLSLGYPQGVAEQFFKELEAHGSEPEYRIGIWRVLARASSTPAQRDAFVDRILSAACDDTGSDRVHAIEALAKLRISLTRESTANISRWVQEANPADAAFGHWLLALSADEEALRSQNLALLTLLLQSKEPLARLRSAYSLGRFDQLLPASQEALLTSGEHSIAEPLGDTMFNLANAHVMIAAWKVAHHDNRNVLEEQLRSAIEQLATKEPAIERATLDALAELGSEKDLPRLTALLASDDADLAASAAHAILRIERRRPHKLTTLDWMVVATYGIGMIGVGVFYARRTKNTDDYLLGGRTMNPWMVGISLFATLLSTLTYLAIPGEMIRYGPMVLAGLAAFPLVAWIVGWSMIPFFMRMKATTAYEILETRFGYGGRLLGSAMFLLMRLFWMAVIVYKTTEIVLMPLFGLPVSATPWVCAGVGVLTVIYSSMGGLRTVVMTDVAETQFC